MKLEAVMKRIFLFAVLLATGFLPASAQNFLPTEYDPSIPTLESIIGHSNGAEITSPDEALTYLEAIRDAAPNRMRIVQYAESWEGRKLVYAVIASQDNLERIEEIQADLAKIGNGEIQSAEQSEIVARTPAVVWLAYSVHGDEISGTDAALALAHHLVAAQNDPIVANVLENTIVIIDPMQNPDGRNRFVNSFEASRGLEAVGDRYAAEHDQPWPGGRPNHYLFDLNRDWFAVTQPETRGKIAAILDWHPVVVADVHEMGGDETYFFPPSARPFNPGIVDPQKEKQDLIGQNHARWFDREGLEYFTREIFDAFYPGYGDMWPTLNGAIAMTYEQASARGLKWTRSDGSLLTYEDGVRAHFIASLSTVEVVARNKAQFLGDYAAYRASAIEEGRNASDRYFVFDLSKRRSQVEQMGQQLAFQGIRVDRLPGQATACGETLADGALVVDRAQPSGRLAYTLLAEQTDLPEDFVEEQENRRDRGLDAELYDVTAWSVPLMSGVDIMTCERLDMSSANRVVYGADAPAAASVGDSTFGYAVPWTDNGQGELVLRAISMGFVGKSADKPFQISGAEFPKGTVVFSRAANEGKDFSKLEQIAVERGARLSGLPSSWTTQGPNLGSSAFKLLSSPRVAVAWGDGVSSLDAGALRYVLERRYNIPITPIRTRTLSRADLSLYDVLLLPSGRYGVETLGSAVREFVDEGGVLIGFGSALRFVSDKDVALLSTQTEKSWVDPDDEKSVSDGDRAGTRLESEGAYLDAIASEGPPDVVPGVLLNTVADPGHWLSAGYEDAVALLVGSDIYTPLAENVGTNVFRFAARDNILASGYLWDENAQQLAFKPFVMAQPKGQGLTIGFTQSPVTRGYLNGLDLILLNAILLGPAHTR